MRLNSFTVPLGGLLAVVTMSIGLLPDAAAANPYQAPASSPTDPRPNLVQPAAATTACPWPDATQMPAGKGQSPTRE